MKRRLIKILLLIIIFFPRYSYADDKYTIESISLGDSLLDYMSRNEIKEEFKRTNFLYQYLKNPNKFGQVYLYEGNFKNYDYLSFAVKPDDKDYKIYAVLGSLEYNDINECYVQQKKMAKDLSMKFTNAKRKEEVTKYPLDPTGISQKLMIEFILDNTDVIEISCTYFEKSLKKKHKYTNGLQVNIMRREVSYWLKQHNKN